MNDSAARHDGLYRATGESDMTPYVVILIVVSNIYVGGLAGKSVAMQEFNGGKACQDAANTIMDGGNKPYIKAFCIPKGFWE